MRALRLRRRERSEVREVPGVVLPMNQEDFYICPECGCLVLRVPSYVHKHLDFHAKLASVREAMMSVGSELRIPNTSTRVEIDMEPVNWKDRPDK